MSSVSHSHKMTGVSRGAAVILGCFLKSLETDKPSGRWRIPILRLSHLPLCLTLPVWLPFRRFSGIHCWNAAAAHIAPACWSCYDHRLPWRDPNEDAEDACFASCCFQSGHRWVRYISCFAANTCYEWRQTCVSADRLMTQFLLCRLQLK